MGTEADFSPPRTRPASETCFDSSAQHRWTGPEILHLIDAYQEKWYQLKRSQLKARHWEEVANNVFLRCGGTAPSKSSVQCKHKIEKLRKKYREERQVEEQRGPGVSVWVHFERLDAMERGVANCSTAVRASARNAPLRPNLLDRFAQDRESTMSLNDDAHDTSPSPAFPDGLPTGSLLDASQHDIHRKPHRMFGKNDAFLNLEDEEIPSNGGQSSFKRRKMLTDTPIAELASVVRSLGQGFLKIEQLKIDMQRDNERLRAEMEIKRTGMLLDSQKQIAEMLSKALGRKKGAKEQQSQEI